MSYLDKLNQLRKEYNAEQKRVEFLTRKENPSFDVYSEEGKQAAREKVLQRTRTEYQGKIANLLSSIVKEKNSAVAKVQAIKFPNLLSSEDSKRAIGEQQLTQAQIFLAASRKADQIISSINDALSMGRNDFAMTIINYVLNTPYDPIRVTTEQKRLIDTVKNIYDNSDIKKNLQPAEKELADAESTDNAGKSFEEQLNTGKDFVVLVECWKIMDEPDRIESFQRLESAGHITNLIFAQRKIAEVMNS